MKDIVRTPVRQITVMPSAVSEGTNSEAFWPAPCEDSLLCQIISVSLLESSRLGWELYQRNLPIPAPFLFVNSKICLSNSTLSFLGFQLLQKRKQNRKWKQKADGNIFIPSFSSLFFWSNLPSASSCLCSWGFLTSFTIAHFQPNTPVSERYRVLFPASCEA